MSKRGENCTGCCGSCRRHFTSQTAFEAHRRNFKCLDPSEVTDKDGNLRLEISTEHGTCRIAPNNLTDVIVWKCAGSYWGQSSPDPSERSAA